MDTVPGQTVCYCVIDGNGKIYVERSIPAMRFDLDLWKQIPHSAECHDAESYPRA